MHQHKNNRYQTFIDKGLFISLLLLLCSPASLFAQNTYGFEWIKPYQTYYKFPVVKDAIYRIDSLTLAANGIQVQQINPQKISLYKNGKEELIYIAGEQDLKFNANDFIEFYGKKNNGELDQALYTTSADQPHTFSSLFYS
ncbi:MAG: hypothetical protein ACOVP1_00510 [Bacteroidia bacterium]